MPFQIQDTTGTIFNKDAIINSDLRRQITGIELHCNYAYKLIDEPRFKFVPSIGLYMRRQVVDWKNYIIVSSAVSGAPFDVFFFEQIESEYITYNLGAKLQLQTQYRISEKEWYVTAGFTGQLDSNIELLWNFPIGISKTFTKNN